jgi:hypothetical protein
MHITFAAAEILIVVALAIAICAYRRTLRNWAIAPQAKLLADKRDSRWTRGPLIDLPEEG